MLPEYDSSHSRCISTFHPYVHEHNDHTQEIEFRFLTGMLLPFLFVVLVSVVGCSEPPDPRGARVLVKGEVKYKGEPLAEGNIQFVPADGNGYQSYGQIISGSYTIPPEKGPSAGKTYTVKIIAMKSNGKKILTEAGPVDDKEQFLPTKFNEESTLSCEIKPGENTQNFDLQE